MRKMKSPKNWSLKSKVTWSFMLVVFCVSMLISLLYYKTQRDFFKQNLAAADRIDIVYLMGNLDKQLRLCEKLSDWIYVNRRVETALVRDYAGNPGQFDREIPSVQRLIDDHLNSSSVGNYVVFLYIKGNNGVTLKSSNPDADWLEDFTGAPWFTRGLAAAGRTVWPGIFDNPARYRTARYIIPVARPVIFADTRVPIGWQVFAFSPALAGGVFEDFHQDENRSLTLIDQNGRIVFHQDRARVGGIFEHDFSGLIGDSREGSFFVPINNRPHLVTYRKSAYSGMTMLLIHSLNALDRQTGLALLTLALIFLLTVIMFFVLTSYLSNRLTKPLAAILERLREFSAGVFVMDESIAGNDEMGLIGRGINEMAGRIGKLMEELIQREHEKYQLEYRALISQINPHFIYNALNSIKVMADIQKIEGISAMASSLGTLLREISKGAAEQISIRRELELLEKYLYIQKIRRQGLLAARYHIEDEPALDCLIPRFTLQPLAENAVYHGLDQKGGIGEIDITIRFAGEDVLITMRDNGAGIPADKINRLLTEENSAGDTAHVGLINVDKRIKLFFGSGGLSLESAEGEYTKVSVRFPKKAQ
jgi:two-component system sensor histidine kinase YesM